MVFQKIRQNFFHSQNRNKNIYIFLSIYIYIYIARARTRDTGRACNICRKSLKTNGIAAKKREAKNVLKGDRRHIQNVKKVTSVTYKGDKCHT